MSALSIGGLVSFACSNLSFFVTLTNLIIVITEYAIPIKIARPVDTKREVIDFDEYHQFFILEVDFL